MLYKTGYITRVMLSFISTISLGLMRGLYQTSSWDYNPFITGGAPPCGKAMTQENSISLLMSDLSSYLAPFTLPVTQKNEGGTADHRTAYHRCLVAWLLCGTGYPMEREYGGFNLLMAFNEKHYVKHGQNTQQSATSRDEKDRQRGVERARCDSW